MNWKADIEKVMKYHGDSWGNITTIVSDGDLEEEFDGGFGGSQGCAFCIWTNDRVYFPAVYDGAEWVESVARNPDGKSKDHVGGE